jgi:hypothetical protein
VFTTRSFSIPQNKQNKTEKTQKQYKLFWGGVRPFLHMCCGLPPTRQRNFCALACWWRSACLRTATHLVVCSFACSLCSGLNARLGPRPLDRGPLVRPKPVLAALRTGRYELAGFMLPCIARGHSCSLLFPRFWRAPWRFRFSFRRSNYLGGHRSTPEFTGVLRPPSA